MTDERAGRTDRRVLRPARRREWNLPRARDRDYPACADRGSQIIKHRTLDRLAMLVIAMRLLSARVPLITGPRFLLAKDVVTGHLRLAVLGGLIGSFRLFRQLLKGRNVWDRTAKQRATPAPTVVERAVAADVTIPQVWFASTAFWSDALLADTVIRLIIPHTLPVRPPQRLEAPVAGHLHRAASDHDIYCATRRAPADPARRTRPPIGSNTDRGDVSRATSGNTEHTRSRSRCQPLRR